MFFLKFILICKKNMIFYKYIVMDNNLLIVSIYEIKNHYFY